MSQVMRFPELKIEEPQVCGFPKCGFVPVGDSAALDERHLYCLHCRNTVHLYGEIVGRSRYGVCRNCGYRHTVGVKVDGFLELHDSHGKFVLGIGGSA